MCAIDDGEPWDVHRRVERRARKAHVCVECRRVIRVGENYTYDVGCCDGEWRQFKTCRHCICLGMWLDVMCGGYPHTELAEEINEHRQEYGSTLLDELQDAMLDKWDGGGAPVPLVAAIEADARNCLAAVTA